MTKANQSAFPFGFWDHGYQCACEYPGMTMREWYAGQALVGILAMHADPAAVMPEETRTASNAFAYADAMLAEAAKGKTVQS